ncbi:glycoside hydrolase family 99-like domain-containing protein [Homoserinibacter sp. GY 40078]|uniref:glycoside hydrolase family 99-like domain-containing protein n=1 Tax=Homoserinibacter sp. GY 40078 TaxID=2603275 RepID=UPI00164FF00A|nr:glycoside hydrolase family 99-like domain-containing protein [Homoserinibacter sp. GY 40078]
MTEPEIAAIYFPSWHADRRRDAYLGDGFTEWELVRAGRPRFPEHRQPIVPLDGHLDESDPAVMSGIVRRAADAGVSAFLWDWYWYDEADFLNRPLDETYLALPDPAVQFALMWANHDWRDVFPARTEGEPALWWPGAVDAEQFDRMCEVIVHRYLVEPSYWKVDGAAWFSVFSYETLLEGLGGAEAAAAALRRFRDMARAAGVGELHLNVLNHWFDVDPAELRAVGFDSIGSYGWGDVMPLDRGPTLAYGPWAEENEARWEAEAARQSLPFVPTVTMGWDSTTRVHQDDPMVVTEWPHLPVVVDPDPDRFEQSVRRAREHVERHRTPPVVIVNAWNEWTEGSYLEPDERFGDAFPLALRRGSGR